MHQNNVTGFNNWFTTILLMLNTFMNAKHIVKLIMRHLVLFCNVSSSLILTTTSSIYDISI